MRALWRRAWPLLLVLAISVGFGLFAWAGPSSGGSFGGSGFGGGGGGGGGGDDGAWIEVLFYILYYGFQLMSSGPLGFCIGCVLIALIIFLAVRARRGARGSSRYSVPARHGPDPGRGHLVMVQIAFPPGFDLREQFAKLARKRDAGTDAGRASLLAKTCGLLGTRAERAGYAALLVDGPLAMRDLEQRYNARASEERARFRRDAVRAEQGGMVVDKGDQLAGASTSGWVVVTIVTALAVRFQAGAPSDATALAELLGQLRALASTATVYGLEVIWTPAAKGDVLREDELLPLFPALAGVGGARATALKCAFCGQPYDASRKQCPACGGANTGAAA